MDQRPKYSKTAHREFSEELNRRVYGYFNETGLNPTAGHSMVNKTFFLVGLYTAVYSVIISGTVTNLALLFLLWGLLGVGQSFIGMCVMHDTVHGAYTKDKTVRRWLQIPIIAIGVEERIWRIEHNILHHTYPNVDGIDQDIHPRWVFRFTKDQARKWYHAYQHIYASIFYCFLIIEWLTVKDFLKVIRFYRLRFFKSRREAVYVATLILFKKFLFYFFFLIIPLYVLPFSPLTVVSMFLTMLAVAGFVMTIVFQLAHVVDHCESEADYNHLAEKNWHVYQLETTCNFAHDNRPLSYLIGGLNYQIEHHLFPQICHSHYPEISKIVKQTADDFGIPYHYEPTFLGAVGSHFRHLKTLGAH